LIHHPAQYGVIHDRKSGNTVLDFAIGIEGAAAYDQVKAVLASDPGAKAQAFAKTDYQADLKMVLRLAGGRSFSVRGGVESKKDVSPNSKAFCKASATPGDALCPVVSVLDAKPSVQTSSHVRVSYLEVWPTKGVAGYPGFELAFNDENIGQGQAGYARVAGFVTPDFDAVSGGFKTRFGLALDTPVALRTYTDKTGSYQPGDLLSPTVFAFAGATF